MNCTRCSWQPKGSLVARQMRPGPAVEYVVAKASGDVRQWLCPDHVAALRGSNIEVRRVVASCSAQAERLRQRRAVRPVNGRIGSHAQPCKLVWCTRPECDALRQR